MKDAKSNLDFKSNMASLKKDLLQMATLMDESFKNYVNDTSSIKSAADRLRDYSKNKQKCWKYNISGLTFKNIDSAIIMLPQNTETNPILLEDITVTLSADIIGNHWKTDLEIQDPFANIENDTYSVQLILTSIYATKEKVQNLKNAWHLDRHFDETDADFFHPHYHLHNGGYALTNDTELETGGLMILESPRVMHPPMDGILAIDFVIRNFYTFKEHKDLTERNPYKELLRKAQFRFLRPYILSLASHWVHFTDEKYDITLKPKVVLPNLQ